MIRKMPAILNTLAVKTPEATVFLVNLSEDTGYLYTVVQCSYQSSEITKLATNFFISYAELTYCLHNTKDTESHK